MKPTILPSLIVSRQLKDASVDLDGVAKLMKEQGLAADTIGSTTIYIDNLPHLTVMGSVWPKYLAKLRYPNLRPNSHVMRLSSKMLFTGTTQRSINHTLVHEIEHLMQVQRKDASLIIGYLTNLAFLATGFALGLASNPNFQLLEIPITFITALFGLRLGYLFSLHEIQARNASRTHHLTKNLIKL